MASILGHISKNQIKFIRSLQQKKVRDEEELFVAEGNKCIGELIHHFDLVTLVITSEVESLKLNVESNLESEKFNSYVATGQEIAQMSSLKTPQGSLAVFRQQAVGQNTYVCTLTDREHENPTKQSLMLALDGIQDPGNLGTIIRTADWFGITDIYCSQDTADCYNPKVVQATMGALARVNIHYVNLVEWLQTIGDRRQADPIYGTLLDGRNIYEKGAITDATRGIIIMGNEGNGISPEVRKYITHPLYIPSYKEETIESLNVAIATGVVLAEFRRQETNK